MKTIKNIIIVSIFTIITLTILTITAIVVGLISASNANKDKTPNDNNPPIVDETPGTDTENDFS